ncbi:MAG TPA: Na-translocating system protein MpsC family protein [Solirubrobacteraceae bacterium]
MPGVRARPSGEALTRAISAAIVKLYAEVYGHNRTTASTYINDNVVVCILEDILTPLEQELVAAGNERDVIDGRVAFQADREDKFSTAVERLTQRRVIAFMSANQTSPGIACELFFLAPAEPVT